MVVKSRRTGARSWTRSIFAFLWIVVGGLSSLYLFTLFTDPAALSAYNVQLSAGGATPAVAIPPGKGPLSAAQAATLKDSLSALSKQMAEINTRLETAQEPADPVASLPEPESPPQAAEAQPAPEPQEPVEMVAVEETEIVETAPAPPALVPPAPEPTEPEPAPRAELVLPTPAPVVVDAPVIADLPPVVTSPVEVEPAPVTMPEATPAPAPTAPAELASIDPVTLPPAANDGSTRYGIEIGTVSKREALRPLWRELLTKHAALVAGLQPRRVLAPDKKWRLIAGPFANAQDAEGACTLFKKADRPCAATVYAGDAL